MCLAQLIYEEKKHMITDQLAKYYATIAQQYERVYDKPERQEDLEVLRDKVADGTTFYFEVVLAPGTPEPLAVAAPRDPSLASVPATGGAWGDLRVLIVDEPTRGIDVGTKSEVHQVLFDMAKKGVAVIVISSDLPEVMAVSDRIITLSEGRVTGEIHGDDASEERLMTMMAINHNALNAA